MDEVSCGKGDPGWMRWCQSECGPPLLNQQQPTMNDTSENKKKICYNVSLFCEKKLRIFLDKGMFL
jgi:hypothetical protein